MLKTLSLSELRRVAERTRLVKVPAKSNSMAAANSSFIPPLGGQGAYSSSPMESVERIPWRVWYVSASNGDCIRGEECVTLAVYTPSTSGEGGGGAPGAYPSRLVMFTASGQTRRLRDCCILRADDFVLRV